MVEIFEDQVLSPLLFVLFSNWLAGPTGPILSILYHCFVATDGLLLGFRGAKSLRACFAFHDRPVPEGWKVSRTILWAV